MDKHDGDKVKGRLTVLAGGKRRPSPQDLADRVFRAAREEGRGAPAGPIEGAAGVEGVRVGPSGIVDVRRKGEGEFEALVIMGVQAARREFFSAADVLERWPMAVPPDWTREWVGKKDGTVSTVTMAMDTYERLLKPGASLIDEFAEIIALAKSDVAELPEESIRTLVDHFTTAFASDERLEEALDLVPALEQALRLPSHERERALKRFGVELMRAMADGFDPEATGAEFGVKRPGAEPFPGAVPLANRMGESILSGLMELVSNAFGTHDRLKGLVPAFEQAFRAPPAERQEANAHFLRSIADAFDPHAAEVTQDERAQIVGMLEDLRGLPVDERVPMVQRLFPALGAEEARAWGAMLVELPREMLSGLVAQIAPAEIRRLTRASGVNPPAHPLGDVGRTVQVGPDLVMGVLSEAPPSWAAPTHLATLDEVRQAAADFLENTRAWLAATDTGFPRGYHEGKASVLHWLLSALGEPSCTLRVTCNEARPPTTRLVASFGEISFPCVSCATAEDWIALTIPNTNETRDLGQRIAELHRARGAVQHLSIPRWGLVARVRSVEHAGAPTRLRSFMLRFEIGEGTEEPAVLRLAAEARATQEAVLHLTPPDDTIASARARQAGLLKWLTAEHPEVFTEQRHVRAGTCERIYWHHGYMMALGDLLRSLGVPFEGDALAEPSGHAS